MWWFQEEDGSPVVGFRQAKESIAIFTGFSLFPATSLATKGDSITFSSPTIEGTVFRRNKLDGESKHPWKAEVTEGDNGVSASTITSWFASVYEPDFTAVTPTITNHNSTSKLTEVTTGSISGSLSVVANSNTSNPVTYQGMKTTVAPRYSRRNLFDIPTAFWRIPITICLSSGDCCYCCCLMGGK